MKYHHGNLRETLIQGALKFLEKNPLENLSLNTLAIRAGVSQAAPYRHFKNRNELLAAISQQGFEIKMKYMLEAFIKNRKKPKELLHGCAQSYFKMGLSHPQHFKLMLSSTVCPSPEYPELEKAAGLTFALLKKVIELLQKEGIVGPGDPYHKSMHCWAMVNGFTTLFVERRLNWLGVNDKNSQPALKIFINEYLAGTHSALAPNANFKMFSSAEAEGNLERIKVLEAAVDQMIERSESDKLS
ncbi:MAG: TetR/AcrR family transcriptional regulator [Xanthomonadaceae bacterium]|nr:TetR/AcrR family transcriptional regulator [Xanthomonadaceae bacterium]